MARARGVRRKSGPKNNVWSVVVMNQVAVSTTVIEFPIVESADWQGGIQGFQHGTLLRIRGWMSTAQVNTTAASVAVFAAVYVVDEDEATNDPSALVTYTDEDVLWTGGIQFTGGTTTAPGHSQLWDVDVKTMRKINSGQDVRMTIVATGASILVSGILRGLVRRGGN